MSGEQDDDVVGFGRPPKHSRFKPGRSGNPRGRAKKKHTSPNSAHQRVVNDVLAELDETLTVRENGREKKITKRRAFVIALVNSAIKGESARSTRWWLLQTISALPNPKRRLTIATPQKNSKILTY
jgi:Family of unknown function (DUF5681)